MQSNSWAEAEFIAVVREYLRMLEKEQAGEPYIKVEVVRHLLAGELSARSRGSIEFRMCNISAVLKEMGRPYIQGYKPRENVGDRGRRMIQDAFTNLEGHSGKAGKLRSKNGGVGSSWAADLLKYLASHLDTTEFDWESFRSLLKPFGKKFSEHQTSIEKPLEARQILLADGLLLQESAGRYRLLNLDATVGIRSSPKTDPSRRILNEVFLHALGDAVLKHNEGFPLELDLSLPYIVRLRVYLYRAGRSASSALECRLRLPGQAAGEPGNLDDSDDRTPLVVAFDEEYGVFILFDHSTYVDFRGGRPLSVKPEVVLKAIGGQLTEQTRRRHMPKCIETILCSNGERLLEAIERRLDLTGKRMVQERTMSFRIWEAAEVALKELGKPTHVKELHTYIVDKGYFIFGAKDPAGALASTMLKHCTGAQISIKRSPEIFFKDSPATYGLLEWQG